MLNVTFLGKDLYIQQIYTSSCLLDVSVFQHTQNNSFSSCSQSCSFPSVSYFNEQQHIHSIAQARKLTLPSPLILTPRQILSNSPHYSSDLFSYLLLIYPVTI